MGLHLENEGAVVKTPTIISNNPVYVRNIRGMLNTSNKEMPLKLCTIAAEQGLPYECKNLFKRPEKRFETMDMKFSG